MKIKEQKYNCWFFINQHIHPRNYEAIENIAVSKFLDFIKDKNYGNKSMLFRFDLYVEETINFGRHRDGLDAHLSAHLNHKIFDLADENERVKLLLNAALIMLKFYSNKVPQPKDFNPEKLVEDFEKYLTLNSLLLTENQLEKTIIKHFDTTRFQFVITTTIEVKESKIHYDLIHIEDFINNKLAGQVFGESIRKVHFGYEIFDFNGQFADFHESTKNYQRVGVKYKDYLIVKHFDYSVIKDLDKISQFQLLKSKILEGINDYDNLKRKPKDFDKSRFLKELNQILIDYEIEFIL